MGASSAVSEIIVWVFGAVFELRSNLLHLRYALTLLTITM